MFWSGWVVSGLVVLFLSLRRGTKILEVAPVMEACERLGLPPTTVVGIGTVLLACTLLYAIPQTAVLGAILLTAVPRRCGRDPRPGRQRSVRDRLRNRVRRVGLARSRPASAVTALDGPPTSVGRSEARPRRPPTLAGASGGWHRAREDTAEVVPVLRLRHRQWFVTRKTASALTWLLLPTSTLLVPRSSAWEPLFRPQPFNASYDAMFIAATAGIALASLWIVATGDPSAGRHVPVSWSWWNALDLFELMLCAALGAGNLAAGAVASAVVWGVAFAVLGALTVMLAGAERSVSMSPPPGRTGMAVTASILLVVMAVLFIAFPVLQPWSGPPEPFVRWHPFSEHAELVWRGIFLSFAAAMLLAALDPLGRHRFFMILLVTSGFLHAGEMAVDNLCAARMGGMNGNAEHLYGDVLGWFVIAAASLILLVADRRPSSA